MKPSPRGIPGRSALDLVEEATHRLRTAPKAALAAYYAGTLPFVLGALYFCADMGQNPFARQHLMAASLGMAGLFFWMKYWQAVFARIIRAAVKEEATPAWPAAGEWKLFYTQAWWHAGGLFILPLTLMSVFLFPWAYAFFQNITVLGTNPSGSARPLPVRAAQQTAFAGGENIAGLAVLIAFGLFVLIDVGVAGVALPSMMKTLFGMDNAFTRNKFALLNTTFFAAQLGLVYLCVDPIVKVFYVLRCFYGESRTTGEDLKVELKTRVTTPAALIAVAVLILLSGSVSRATAAEAAPPPAAKESSSTNPDELDHAIQKVIQGRKYTWRMPKEKVSEEQTDNIITRFFKRLREELGRVWGAFRDWWVELIRRLFSGSRKNGAGSGTAWMMLSQLLLYVLVLAVAIALALLAYRIWRGPRRDEMPIMAEAIQPIPDLNAENVDAGQLPEDGWIRLAQEFLGRGEFRLAIRAFYLAGLVHLARRNLITLARFKSNRDYRRELRRRAHSVPLLLTLFDENISVFDRVWYGAHEATRELAAHSAANFERIKTAP